MALRWWKYGLMDKQQAANSGGCFGRPMTIRQRPIFQHLFLAFLSADLVAV